MTVEPKDFSSITPREATALQNELRLRVSNKPSFTSIASVAGVDVGIKEGRARAAIAVLSYPALEVVELASAERKVEFPYIPGLLAFREIPVILDACAKLKSSPDVFMVDGQGYAHPRRFGVACHLGVELDAPAIGCAKSRLIGEYEEPGLSKGDASPLMHHGEIIGKVVRTRANVKPVFVSIGHKVDLDTAVRIVIGAARRRRLPEPISIAHIYAGGNSANYVWQPTPP